MKVVLILFCLIANAFSFDWQSEVQSGDFTEESHPTSTTNINKSGNVVNFIQNGNWIKFADFDFGMSASATNFWIQASKGNSTNSKLRIRLDSLTGPEIGTIQITQTGGWGDFQRFNLFFSQAITGTRDLYIMCEGGSGFLFDLKTFRFQSGGHHRDKDVSSGDYSEESHPADESRIHRMGRQIQNIRDGNWVGYKSFDFADGAHYLWVEGAIPSSGGAISVRVGSPTGAVLGTIDLKSTGSLSIFKPFGCKLSAPVFGIQDLYFTFSGGAGDLFNLATFRFQRLAPDYKAAGTSAEWVKRAPSSSYPAGNFTSESNPDDNQNVRSENGGIGYIGNSQWVGYQAFDFGTGANALTVNASSQNAGGTVEIRTGHPTSGSAIATIAITGTGSWGNYQPFSIDLPETLTGVQDLYLRFVGNGWGLFNIQGFRFQLLDPVPRSTDRMVAAHQFDQASSLGVSLIPGSPGIGSLTNGTWVSYGNFHFGQGANLVTVVAATPNKGGAVEIRLDSPIGPRLATLDVTHTGSWNHFREYTAALLQPISGIRNLYIRFVDSNGQGGSLLNLKEFIFENKATVLPPVASEGTLAIYDPVTGLDPSPYYSYSIQKISELNAPLKQNATNWLSPFAWFSECKSSSDPFSTAYYAGEIGGWSHTYCNFELGKNTPIVVKITRNTVSAVPSGPIYMANAHPAHKVQSCEIINGEVYVVMNEPALITVDIDGQMDARDAPRSAPAELASSKPYASKQFGSHAVSIFANPVIMDKPVVGSPGVIYINPGDPLPAPNDPTWTTLYFGKGVHHFSRDLGGQPSIWKNGDAYILMSNKTCYIAGDAIVYGNFDGRTENSAKTNVRVYGHGTLSGAKMPHWDDPYWDEPAQAGTNYLDRPISLSSGYNCRFEGITVADPANHGIAFDFGSGNVRRWIKQISWRANSDMGGIPGVIEDCFYRLQDDGPYVGGGDVRRTVFWFDCNGAPFRGTFVARETVNSGYQAVVEDCDIIYARSNWGGSVFAFGDAWSGGTYPDGTRNTAQHTVFRNIRVTDPRPSRSLFGLDVEDTATSGFAGIRFEGIDYRHPHTWGSKDSFTGTSLGPVHHLYLKGVSINGKRVNPQMLADPSVFSTANISNFVFDSDLDPNLFILNSDDPQQTYLGNGTLRVSADTDGKIELATSSTIPITEFAMTGGLITIDSGVVLQNGGWSKGVWTNNQADMEVNGTLDLWDGNPVFVDALTGAGGVAFGWPWTVGARQLIVGVMGGSGTFSGTIASTHFTGSFVRIVKNGAGTQVFNNLANQKPKELVVNGGAVDLKETSNATLESDILGAGNLIKSGPGVLRLTGSLTQTGSISITEGTLSVGPNLAPTINFSIAIGAVLDLDFAGQRTVNSLSMGSAMLLPPGIYSSNHATYGPYFSGPGSLLITGSGYEVWAGTNSVSGESPEADSDGDGMMNLLEYVFGGDLLKSSSEALPKATVEESDLVLTYKRSDDSEVDTTQVGQWSNDLKTWSNADVTMELISENGNAPDNIKIRIPQSKGANGRLFGRLHVTKP